MAFLAYKSRSDLKERFSLLLLDPGEIYFEDFSAFYYPNGPASGQQKGRLKLCSRSILFDPESYAYPIIKLSFKAITEISKEVHPQTELLYVRSPVLRIISKESVLMKENNITQPYSFNKQSQSYRFTLTYTHWDACVPQMEQLKRASSLPYIDHSTMINTIVLSRQTKLSFNTSWLDSFHEDIVLETVGDRIAPLVMNPGRIMLTSSRLYFQPFNNIDPMPVTKVKLKAIARVIKRRFLLRQIGLEIFCPNNTDCEHLYLSFQSEEKRNELYEAIVTQKEVHLEEECQENMILRWQNGVISNFEYLSYLNSVSDRSTSDLTQYPVYPWIIADQTSTTLDLTSPATFRDLTKPVGALNPERFSRLKKRYDEMPENPFLYGSHYSTPGYVLFFLSRIAPEYVLCLQNGRFDYPDRMFNSIEKTWKNCLESTTDFKELIPEFYDSNGEFLRNNPLVTFGHCEDGRAVHNVDLPPWAKDSYDYVQKLREALECDYVSSRLHHWIDLIFGYQQRGEEAKKVNNVFYHLTYEGAVDLEQIEDSSNKSSIEAQIMEFGQTPKQLFTKPHPQRLKHQERKEVNYSADDANYSTPENDKNGNADPVPALSTHNAPVITEHIDCYHRYQLHKCAIKDISISASNDVYTVSTDCTLKIYSLNTLQQLQSMNPARKVLQACIVLPDKNNVILACDCEIVVYSVQYGRILDQICAHDNTVTALCLTSDYLISASIDSTLKIWNIDLSSKTPNISIFLEFEHDTGVLCVCAFKQLVVCGTEAGQVCVWDINTQTIKFTIEAHHNQVTAVKFNQDGNHILTGGYDGMVNVYDVNTTTQVYQQKLDNPICSILWDSTRALLGDSKGSIHICHMLSGVMLKTIPNAHTGAVTGFAISNNQLVSAGADCQVCVWRMNDSR